MVCFSMRRFIYFVLGVTVLTGVLYPVWRQEVFHFPKPTGSYGVGIKTYHWIDNSRKETLGNDPAHPYRELMVNIWYPTKKQTDQKPTKQYAPYFVDYVFDYVKEKHKELGDLLFSQDFYSYAQSGVPIFCKTQTVPVVIFSHGLSSFLDANTAYCEDLASHGYVVVAIGHTYDSCVVQFPDGRIVDGQESLQKRFKNMSAITDEQLEQEHASPEYDLATKRWIADVQFILDKLEHLNDDKQSIFYKTLDQKHIGMFGHSIGGSTALQMCRRDARIKAAINLDGSLFGSDATKATGKPCMLLLSGNVVNYELQKERPASKHLPAFEQLEKSNGRDMYTFVLQGAQHYTFCDAIFLYVLKRIGFANVENSIDDSRATEIVNAYLVSFFDKYLKGKPSPLLDGKNTTYPEMKPKWWNIN